MKKKHVIAVLFLALGFGLFAVFAQVPDLCVTGVWPGRYVYAGDVDGYPSWSCGDVVIVKDWTGDSWLITDGIDTYMSEWYRDSVVGPYYDGVSNVFAYVDYCDSGGGDNGGETNVFTNCVSVCAIDWSGEGMTELLVALVAPWAIFGFLFGLAFIGFFSTKRF